MAEVPQIPSYVASPYFITAGMLMPPWADPNAVMKFSNYLVGMGLKMGSVAHGKKFKAAMKYGKIKVNPHLKVGKVAGKALKNVGKGAKAKMGKVGKALGKTKIGKFTRRRVKNVRSA